MNLVVFIPIVVLVVVLVLIVGRRKKAGPGESGLDDRSDVTERPELRGDEQWKQRE